MIIQRTWLLFALYCVLLCGIWQENFVSCVQTRKIRLSSHQPSLLPEYEPSIVPEADYISQRSIEKRNLQQVLQLRGGASQVSIISTIISFFFRLLQQLFGIKPPKKYAKSKVSKNSGKTGKVSPKAKNNKAAAPAATSSGMARLQREMQTFIENPPSNCELKVDPKNIRAWTVTITGAEGTVYANEKYQLQMNFPKDYPAKPPSVFFLKPVPKHQHVYTNGDICLNLLGRDWRPIMTAEGLAVSILSMLSSAKEKKLPQDNAMHADAAPGQQQDNWMYHDDKC